MMTWTRPDLLWFLWLGPLFGLLAGWAWRRRVAATTSWSARGLWKRLLPGYSPVRLTLLPCLFAAAIVGVLLALAQPRWGTSEIQVERQGVDVVFVLDTSLSMATRDTPPDRLWVAQTLIRRLVQGLPGHRVALVQAEGDGVVMVPLTADSAVVDLLLDAVLPGTLPLPGTELARSLERALALFPAGGSRHQVLILVSDGEDHGQGLPAITTKLKTRGIATYTIGVGTVEGKPLELPPAPGSVSAGSGSARPGSPVEYKRDEEGNVVVSRLMEASLETLSRETGGVYVRATDAAAVLEPILEPIGEMDHKVLGSEDLMTLEDRFQWPLGLAIAALGLHLLISPFRRAPDPTAEGSQ